MNVVFHAQFVKQYRHAPDRLRKKVDERIQLFVSDQFADALNNHASRGKYSGYRSINITGDYRAIYKFIGPDHFLFVIFDTHGNLYK